MTTNHFHLAVIVGSTREGRFGPTVAHWFAAEAARREDITVDLIDLLDVDLPVGHPARPSPGVAEFAARLARADGVVVVTPEYNHGYPASLKHAIDLVHAEWQAKPVAFVAYGGRSGGLRAVEQLRQVFAELHAVTVRDVVSFHLASQCFDEAGVPHDEVGTSAAVKTMLDQLAWWAVTLRAGRHTRPYAA